MTENDSNECVDDGEGRNTDTLFMALRGIEREQEASRIELPQIDQIAQHEFVSYGTEGTLQDIIVPHAARSSPFSLLPSLSHTFLLGFTKSSSFSISSLSSLVRASSNKIAASLMSLTANGPRETLGNRLALSAGKESAMCVWTRNEKRWV